MRASLYTLGGTISLTSQQKIGKQALITNTSITLSTIGYAACIGAICAQSITERIACFTLSTVSRVTAENTGVWTLEAPSRIVRIIGCGAR